MFSVPGRHEEHAKNRLHLPGAGAAASRVSDVLLRQLHGPRCTVTFDTEDDFQGGSGVIRHEIYIQLTVKQRC